MSDTHSDIDFAVAIVLGVACLIGFVAFLILGPIDTFLWLITAFLGVMGIVFLLLAHSVLEPSEGNTEKEKMYKVTWNGQPLKCPLCGGDDWRQTGDDRIGILLCANCQPSESAGGEGGYQDNDNLYCPQCKEILTEKDETIVDYYCSKCQMKWSIDGWRDGD